ncbi:uncharacterized protein [Procambarus clarkii]|uniref:uncharacterized protein isoform X2 n=1 Tax=Procambarus clarkii TaxID=6728 RepID=UPI001E67596E|nr:uncharacterized protein LOC123757478 isoform X2 [Procambarus clarkii]
MGRYGVGHGALAIRDRRRRVRRTSVAGPGSHHQQRHPENYTSFAQRHQQRKSSVSSSQSAPVKGSAYAIDAAPEVAIMPGQIPPSYDLQKTKSLTEVAEGPLPGPSWWPGPPFQQGGVVHSPPVGHAAAAPFQEGMTEFPKRHRGLLSGVLGLLTGRDTWAHIQERLLPHLRTAGHPPSRQAAMTNRHLTFDQELPNGKNAWGGRVGVQKQASDAQKRWVTKNKVGDASGGSLEKRPDGRYRQTGVVNIVLYVGLGLISLGLIITFVGMGEHGFKSPELRLIGPSLIGCGFLFCLLRLFFCSTPACCAFCCRKSEPLDEKALLSPSRETLAEDSSEGQQQPQPQHRLLHPLEKPKQRHQQEEEVHHATRITSMPAAPEVQSSIPNFIEDEGDEDAELGLEVEYMDEISEDLSPGHRLAPTVHNSRPASSHSHTSTSSKLADVHGITRQNSEIVLDPSALERSGD